MFVLGRGHLTGESQLMRDTQTGEVIGFLGLLGDSNRKKFWTQVAVLPGSNFMAEAVRQTISKALSIEPKWNLQPNINDLDAEQIAAWNSWGFNKIQTSYAMNIENLTPVSHPYPILPEGVFVRQLHDETDWHSVHQLNLDAFEGHFGFVPLPFKDFQDFRLDSETFDPHGIHILSLDGIDIGYVEVTNEIKHINKGYINTIGVIHRHHKKGFGKILLQWAFAYCASIGFTGAELYVDIENKSGALKFYRDCGMSSISAHGTYENRNWNQIDTKKAPEK
jgi:ribosomal protein S18 acetylase RimI-like enzyme